jgi:hypothetical protein
MYYLLGKFLTMLKVNHLNTFFCIIHVILGIISFLLLFINSDVILFFNLCVLCLKKLECFVLFYTYIKIFVNNFLLY